MMKISFLGEGWQGVFDFPYKERNKKPRIIGQTMVIDKGLGLTEVKELLDTAANYIDYIKLGFGTSALYSANLLEKKIALVKSYGVDIYPGGTFLEIAMLQNNLAPYLERAKKLGFTCIEVSDGTIEMSQKMRKEAIDRAHQMGFKVLSEVGKKDSRDELSDTKILEQIQFDIEYGVYKVIVEGRESGKGVVIYDENGVIKEAELEKMIKGISQSEKILWEAPLKNQQKELIMCFGPNVSLGNIHPEDVLALEALRLGLRGDTLRNYIINNKKSVG
jgi:phosphosulfolactate synthase